MAETFEPVQLTNDTGQRLNAAYFNRLETNMETFDDRIAALEAGGGAGGTPADGSVTNVKVATNAAISADKLANGNTNVVMLASERTKLTGVATGATANSADATLLARANHTGTQPVSSLSTTGTASSTTFLRGDGAWATPAGGGSPVETVHAVGNSGTALTLNATVTGTYKTVTLTGNCAFTLAGGTSGQVSRMDLELVVGGAGGFTATWTNVTWSGGTPVVSTTVGQVDCFTFWSRDGGTSWRGAVAGKGFA